MQKIEIGCILLTYKPTICCDSTHDNSYGIKIIFYFEYELRQ